MSCWIETWLVSKGINPASVSIKMDFIFYTVADYLNPVKSLDRLSHREFGLFSPNKNILLFSWKE
jgi:hypothetical protein